MTNSNTPEDRRITWAEYDRNWLPIHDRVFSGRKVSDEPFRDGRWEKVLLAGGLRLDAGDLQALGEACNRESSLVLVDPKRRFADTPPRLVPWSVERLDQVSTVSGLTHVMAHLFDTSGDWGLATDPEGYGVLGGKPRLIGRFVEGAGGRERLIERFMANAPGLDPEDWGYDLVERLFLMVGWEVNAFARR